MEDKLMSASADVRADDQGISRFRPLAAGVIGNFVEWYDFGIYGYLSIALSKNFFPGHGMGPLLATFGVFGVAFVFRPLGGLIFGSLGDKLGRRSILAGIVLMISISTALIGVLPTYAQIGWLAPVLLIVLRSVQGFAAGGEYGGASSFVFEYAPLHRRGIFGGVLALSTYLSYLTGSLFVFGLGATLSEQAMTSWGWRLPFLAAAPLGLVGLYLRMRVEETPEFREVRSEAEVEKAPLRASFSGQRRRIVVLFGFLISNAVGPYLLTTYIPTFLKGSGGLNSAQVFIALSAVLVMMCLLLPVGGWLSDRVGRKPIMAASTILFVLTPLPAFLLFQTPSVAAAFGGMALIAIGQVASTGIAAVVISELFPTTVRYSSASITYNLAYMLFGGTAPLIATWLVTLTGSSLAPALYLMTIAAISTVFVGLLPETSPTSRRYRSS